MNHGHSRLLSLPLETLDQIVRLTVYNVNKHRWKDGDINWHHRISQIDTRGGAKQRIIIELQTIRNLRLVSKQLCAIASRVLMPVLKIHLNEASLTRAHNLLKSKEIASGIQGVQLNLACHPDNLAGDLQLFTRFKMSKFAIIPEDYNLSSDEDVEEDVEEDSSDVGDNLNFLAHERIARRRKFTKEEQRERDEKRANCKLALQIWHKREAAWTAMSESDSESNTESESPQDKDVGSQYHRDQALLLKGFRRFQALHKEQLQLITTGTFARQVASILSALPRLQSLCIKDETNYKPGQRNHVYHTQALFSDEQTIDILSQPITWDRVINVPHEPEPESNLPRVTAASLLWDIPITIGRADVILRKFHLHCFPTYQTCRLDNIMSGYLGSTKEEFTSALSKLESFHLAPHGRSLAGTTTHPAPRTPSQESHIISYIRLCIASSHLKVIGLDFNMFQSREVFHTNPQGIYLDVGQILDALETSGLEKVRLSSFHISYPDLKSLCLHLGPHASSLSLINLLLKTNCGAEVMDLLRSTFGQRISSGDFKLGLYALDGPELHEYYTNPYNVRNPDDGSPVLFSAYDNRAQIAMLDYIKGKLDINPFSTSPVL